MANKEHLKILKKGSVYQVDAWNKWRTENLEVLPDLKKADLRFAHLSGANLNNADLSRTILKWADLRWANLRWADLSNADLSNADLSNADLTEADLNGTNLSTAKSSRANLSGANLNGANLSRANLSETSLNETKLSRANLSRANLSRANLTTATLDGTNLRNVFLHNTIFGDLNLSTVKGLESCRHLGPSIIDHQTLIKSGRLPLPFLRGCGLPDPLIDYLPSLLKESIQFYSCFISYSSKDEAFAERLYADLRHKGVGCWFAPEDLKIGDKTRVILDESIRMHDKLLLVLSKHSVKSDWVEKEVETAMERERKEKRLVLFPIRLDDAVMKIESGWAADIRRTRHIGDFRRWREHNAYQKAFNRLLRDLKQEEKEAKS